MIGWRQDNTRRIAAVDEQAESLALRRGMGIADARARYPGIDIAEADPEADLKLLETLADWCDRYTPLVAFDRPDGLFLDISGCAHLFGGEEKMVEGALSRLLHQGFAARAGVASTPGAAWAAARFCRAKQDAIVSPGDESARLAPLPLAALRIDATMIASLESVGLRDAGALISAPRAPLARRFGSKLVTRIDQALGHAEEAISPRLPAAELSVERHLAEPALLLQEIEHLLGMLAVTLGEGLERRGEGARRLELALFRVDGAVRRIEVGTSRPMRDPRSIRSLFHERLGSLEDSIEAGCGFDLLRLSVLAADLLAPQQTDLAGTLVEEGDIFLFADRVRARLGSEAIITPVPAASHIPERAMRAVPFAEAAGELEPRRNGKILASSSPPRGARPPRLFRRPEPVEVMAEIPEGPPVHFRWRRALHRVARAEGPERIAPEWWQDDSSDRDRDYFRVEDQSGRRYWLYREGFYGAADDAPRWYMHGIFA